MYTQTIVCYCFFETTRRCKLRICYKFLTVDPIQRDCSCGRVWPVPNSAYSVHVVNSLPFCPILVRLS